MHRPSRRSAASLPLLPLLASALLAGCMAPIQNGGVEVRAGAAERLGFLCRWRHGDVAAGSMCGASESERLPPARVGRLQEGERLEGAQALGASGDYRIENDEVVFVIDQASGDLIDAADARVRCDAIEALRPLAALRGEGPARITSDVDPDGTAWITVATTLSASDEVTSVTRYSLRPNDRALLVTTALHNGSKQSLGPFDLGDRIDWGAAALAAPGRLDEPREVVASQLAGVASAVGYATLPLDGTSFSARNSVVSSLTVLAPGARLGPGETTTIERVLVVAPRGDTLSLATELFFLQGGSPGAVELTFVDDEKNQVALPEGLGLVITPSEGGDPLILRAAAESCGDAPARPVSVVAAELPPGSYAISTEPRPGLAAPPVHLTIDPGEVTQAALTLVVTLATEAAPPPATEEAATAPAAPVAP